MYCKINGFVFTEEPGSCGSCPFFHNGRTSISAGDEKGNCVLFEETHHRWLDPPARCKKLFRNASRFNNGEELAIVANLKNHEDNSNS